MKAHFADRLLAAIRMKGAPVCVGIDPRIDRLPKKLRTRCADEVEETGHIQEFAWDVVDAVAPYVPAVKIQSAYFERYGNVGVDLYEMLCDHAREQHGLLVIGDVKRGDIGSTAEAYARGHMSPESTAFAPIDRKPDAITVNGYFGADGLTPFVDVAREEGKGVFVLVRTSNPSGATVQDFQAADGRRFYEHMAGVVAEVGESEGLLGNSGFSCVGAVVGATYPDEARRLRDIMPNQLFLVPGYGAQGASAADCAAAFRPDGSGAIVNASRSVIYAFEREEYAGMPWQKAVTHAAAAFCRDVVEALSAAG